MELGSAAVAIFLLILILNHKKEQSNDKKEKEAEFHRGAAERLQQMNEACEARKRVSE